MNTEKRTKKTKKGKFIVFVLAAVLVITTLLVVGCKDETQNPSGSASPSTSPTPEPQSVGNGNFDLLYDNSDNSDYPRTPKEWSYSIDGTGDKKAPDSSSDLLHGIINVNKDKFDPNVTADEGKDPKFGKLTNPMAPNYDPEKDENTDGEGKPDNGNVLMIYNKNETAIRYKSPSISISSNTFIELSMWVKTVPLEGQAPEDVKAHVNITGGLEKNLYVKEINTAAAANTTGDNVKNGYVQYKFYIAGSAFQSKTIYVELGLGYGDRDNTRENMSGYAFFDDVQMKRISYKEYSAATAGLETAGTGQQSFRANGDPTTQMVANASAIAEPVIAYNYAKDDSKMAQDDKTAFANMSDYAKYDKGVSFTDGGLDPANTQTQIIDAKDFEGGTPFPDDTKILTIDNKARTSYAVRQKDKTSLMPYKYYRISFWVKTEDLSENSALLNIVLSNGVLYDGSDQSKTDYKSLSSFTGVKTPEEELTEEEKETNKWDNWQQYSFLVQTSTLEKDSDIGLEFYLGPQFNDSLSDTFEWKLTQGSAHITAPVIEELYKSEYSSASTGDTAKKVTLGETVSTGSVSNGSFSTPTTAFGEYDFDNGLLAPLDWVGYPYGVANVGGDDEHVAPNKSTDIQSGITNKLLNEAGTKLDPAGNPYALAINALNKTAMGYASTYLTLSANSVFKLTVSVMATPGTKYGVYLVEKSDNKKLLGDGGYKDTGETTEDGDAIYEPDPDYTRMFFEGAGTADGVGSVSADGSTWQTYNFYFKTKDEAKNFRIELWLGNRTFKDTQEEREACYTQGTVYFDSVALTTYSEEDFKKLETDDSGLNVKPDSLPPYAQFPSKMVDYTNADTAPETSESPSPSPSESAGTGEQTPFNWAALVAGLTSLVIVVALAIVGLRKFILDPKRKLKKKKLDKRDPELQNQYKTGKKHYEKKEEPTQEADAPEEEDDLKDVETEHIDAILDDEDEASDNGGDDEDDGKKDLD